MPNFGKLYQKILFNMLAPTVLFPKMRRDREYLCKQFAKIESLNLSEAEKQKLKGQIFKEWFFGKRNFRYAKLKFKHEIERKKEAAKNEVIAELAVEEAADATEITPEQAEEEKIPVIPDEKQDDALIKRAEKSSIFEQVNESDWQELQKQIASKWRRHKRKLDLKWDDFITDIQMCWFLIHHENKENQKITCPNLIIYNETDLYHFKKEIYRKQYFNDFLVDGENIKEDYFENKLSWEEAVIAVKDLQWKLHLRVSELLKGMKSKLANKREDELFFEEQSRACGCTIGCFLLIVIIFVIGLICLLFEK